MRVHSALPPGTNAVEIRLTVTTWLWTSVVMCTTFVLTLLALAVFHPFHLHAISWDFVVAAAAGLALSLPFSWVINREKRIVLTPGALKVYGVRNRTIPWIDVAEVRTERRIGATCVVVQENSGRTTRLPAPTTGLLAWDREFEAKLHAIIAWHRAYACPVTQG